MNFLCGFFMINALWIPPLSIPTVVRMYTWFIIGNIVFKEGWKAMEARNNSATRHQVSSPNWRFVAFAIVALEIAISFKFDRGTGNLEDEPMHPFVFWFWVVVGLALGGFYINLRFIRDTDSETHSHTVIKETPTKHTMTLRSSAKKNR